MATTLTMKLVLAIILFCSLSSSVLSKPNTNYLDDRLMHPTFELTKEEIEKIKRADNPEQTAEYWQQQAAKTVEELSNRKINTNIAKNVIIFLGDGMSVPTIAATRVYIGGENKQLEFEKFPYTAMSKTYCVDKQVADSACTSTAYLTGVKANYATIGVTGNVPLNDCEAMLNSSNHVQSIAYWSQLKNKATGIVTTTTVTNASPAGAYAHTAQRSWEGDYNVVESGQDPKTCLDIATQLVTGDVGKQFKVILGGGRENFLPTEKADPEGGTGKRVDTIDLTETWKESKKAAQESAEYVWNREQLLNLPEETKNVLGLFESNHCNYNLDRNQTLDPSLAEMTEVAINILSKNPDGFFLFVEGGRIDTAHHETRAHKALDETSEFSKAIAIAVNLTSEEDTLIVVTSDHAHTMSYSGYSTRGTDILGLNTKTSDTDSLPYSTLNYANGGGYRHEEDGHRHNETSDDFEDKDYQYSSNFPVGSETHGGDDVIIFARGPWSHLFAGVLEQNVIPAVMKYASCVGDGATACDRDQPGAGSSFYPHFFVFVLSILTYFVM